MEINTKGQQDQSQEQFGTVIVEFGKLGNPKNSRVKTIYAPVDMAPDAALCIWAAYRFGAALGAEIIEVPAGTDLTRFKNDQTVLCFDVGLGAFDEHALHGKFSSSFGAYYEHIYPKLSDLEWEALTPMLELSAPPHEHDPFSIRHCLAGYKYRYYDQRTRSRDWTTILQKTFELYDQVFDRALSQLKKVGDLLKSGKRFDAARIGWYFLKDRPGLRDIALDYGDEHAAEVVMWTQQVQGGKPGDFWVGIISSGLKLDLVWEALRRKEAEVSPDDWNADERREFVGEWFLHHTQQQLYRGSNSKPLPIHRCTALTIDELIDVVQKALVATSERGLNHLDSACGEQVPAALEEVAEEATFEQTEAVHDETADDGENPRKLKAKELRALNRARTSKQNGRRCASEEHSFTGFGSGSENKG